VIEALGGGQGVCPAIALVGGIGGEWREVIMIGVVEISVMGVMVMIAVVISSISVGAVQATHSSAETEDIGIGR
jgi:hypothetical protein